MLCRRIFALLLFALLAGPALSSPSPVTAATDRTVTATIACERLLGSDSGLPKITVTLENHSGLPLHIAYLHAFGAGPNLDEGLTGLKLEVPQIDEILQVADGATETYEPAWAGEALKRSDQIVALIVTSAGVLAPRCVEGSEVQTVTYDQETPTLEGDEADESARIAAEAIGQLESWRAYPALYAMLYPGAQSAISFEQIACWYAERFGPPVTDDVQTIHSTEVQKVAWESWTWKVSGEEFQQSAAVTYTQEISQGDGAAEPVESVMHLVRVDGIWRWFFGASAEGVAGLASDCGLPATT